MTEKMKKGLEKLKDLDLKGDDDKISLTMEEYLKELLKKDVVSKKHGGKIKLR